MQKRYIFRREEAEASIAVRLQSFGRRLCIIFIRYLYLYVHNSIYAYYYYYYYYCGKLLNICVYHSYLAKKRVVAYKELARRRKYDEASASLYLQCIARMFIGKMRALKKRSDIARKVLFFLFFFLFSFFRVSILWI